MHTRGLLWKLVRASMTIVGLVPPVYEQGELLVDGGYLNNIPVDVMRGLGVATVCVLCCACSLWLPDCCLCLPAVNLLASLSAA